MRAFCVISALLAVACAAPQFGYEQHAANPNGAYSGNTGRGGDKYLPPSSKAEEPIVHKQFYTVSAPEDPDNVPRTKHLVLGKPQRNYRVVFIKTPTSGAGNVKYSAEFAPQEEKTVIYVLNKKDNELDASDIATPGPTVPSKPEVFFIKYKTDDEARQAQKEIQGEYDKLGGSSELSEEIAPPPTSVIGSLDGLNPDGSYNYRQTNDHTPSNGHHLDNPNAQYLPSYFKQY